MALIGLRSDLGVPTCTGNPSTVRQQRLGIRPLRDDRRHHSGACRHPHGAGARGVEDDAYAFPGAHEDFHVGSDHAAPCRTRHRSPIRVDGDPRDLRHGTRLCGLVPNLGSDVVVDDRQAGSPGTDSCDHNIQPRKLRERGPHLRRGAM